MLINKTILVLAMGLALAACKEREQAETKGADESHDDQAPAPTQEPQASTEESK